MKKLKKTLHSSLSNQLNDIPFQSKGKSIMFSGGQVLLWMPEKPKTAIEFSFLQHEIFHCACFVLEKVGIKYHDKTCEAYAYLIQFLTLKIYKKLHFL